MNATAPRAGRYAGPIIIGVAALILIGVIVTVFVTREERIRPDLAAFPVPEGAVVRFAREDCTGTRCTVTMGIGPRDELELPAPADELLAEHLVDNGWVVAGEDRYAGPNGDVAELRSYGEIDADERRIIAPRLDDFVDPDELAIVTLEPGAAPR